MKGGKVNSCGSGSWRRAVSPVVALVLLIGLVAVASAGIYVVATDTVDDVQAEGENERAEQSMTNLGSELQTAADSDDARSVDLSMGSSGTTTVDDNSGWINVSIGGEEVANTTLQAIEHTTSDGTTVTYEGGAVWRGSGNETQIVSAPSAQISNDSSERAVYLPLTTLKTDDVDGADSLSVSAAGGSDSAHTAWVNESLTIEIQSEYHAGWADYYESIAERVDGVEVTDDGATSETITVTFGEGDFEDPNEGVETVFDDSPYADAFTVDGDFTYLGVSEMQLDGTIRASGEVDTSNLLDLDLSGIMSFLFGGDTESNILENESFTRMAHDETIQGLLEEARNGTYEERPLCEEDGSGWFASADCTIDEPGTYYITDWNPEETVELDVAEGNITLIAEDDVTFQGLSSEDDLQVHNADGERHATIYTEDDINFYGNAAACVTQCSDGGSIFGGIFEGLFDIVSAADFTGFIDEAFGDDVDPDELDAQGLQIYGTSDSDTNFYGSSSYEGIISTPPGTNNDGLLGLDLADIGFVSIMGAMDTGPVEFVGDLGIVHDPSLEDEFSPPEAAEPPEEPDHDPIYVDIDEEVLELSSD